MRRRDLLLLMGGTAGSALPWSALAQAKVFSIGVLGLGSPPLEPLIEGLQASLRDVGYSEGRNLKLEVRTAQNQTRNLTGLAEELVRLNVDVIVAYQTPAAIAASRATREIPIVMAGVGDPVGSGIIASLARPGGNVTGMTAGVIEVAGKIVELIRELLPLARHFAVLANESDPFTRSYLAENDRIARSIGFEMQPVMANAAGSLDAAFESMVAKHVDAVVIQGSLVGQRVADLAMKYRLPSLSANVLLPLSGGLMSYSAGAVFSETALYVSRILNGEKPVNLPVSFPTKFELTVNLRTAKVLNLTIPPTVLARADDVIE
jgi:putative ABC transport system substrate-binding protein